MIGAWFELGTKKCQSNVATADAMGEAFARSDEAFMPYSGPKVVKLRLGSLDWMKTWSVTTLDPPRPQRTPRPHPEPH